MYFSSDNWAGAHPDITDALARHAAGFAAAYGASDLDKKVEAKFNALFEHDVAVFFVGTGTAANSLALSTFNRPGGVSFCHREAHMFEDECGAPEFFSHGARLAPVDGIDGKINPQLLEEEIRRFPPNAIHAGQPMAVSLTQATEVGTVYRAAEVDDIAAICRKHDLPLHMDGARFANALVALELSPAEMTWRRGVDILSFGATKNGCWCAEAIVVFDPDKARELPFLRKRSAQLFSKTRFISAQFEAYFENDLWLHLASQANAMSGLLQDAIRQSSNARLAWKSDANEVFAVMTREKYAALLQQGAQFYEWKKPHSLGDILQDNEIIVRMVTGFATTQEHVSAFADILG